MERTFLIQHQSGLLGMAQQQDINPDYEPVAASGTDIVLGENGAIGDFLSHIIIQPATTGAGTCTVKDGSTTVYTFTGGGTLADLSSKTIPFNVRSKNGAWKITTGANVAITAFGDFT